MHNNPTSQHPFPGKRSQTPDSPSQPKRIDGKARKGELDSENGLGRALTNFRNNNTQMELLYKEEGCLLLVPLGHLQPSTITSTLTAPNTLPDSLRLLTSGVSKIWMLFEQRSAKKNAFLGLRS